jgi:pimeloyl-ACP methyl ester carboxylesterase
MERREYQTSVGEIWLWGERLAFEGSAPVILGLHGAFNVAEPRWIDRLAPQLPDFAVLSSHVPGNHCPYLVSQSVGAYAAAFSEVLAALGRPAVFLGASIGGLVAFAIRSQNLKSIVALDPPLRTGKLWPLTPDFREKLRADPQDADLAAFLWNVFGVSADGLEDRDYSGLVQRVSVPTAVMFGDDPLLPERTIRSVPSLTDEVDRALFRANPNIHTWLVEGLGHNLLNGGWSYVIDRTREMARFAAPV